METRGIVEVFMIAEGGPSFVTKDPIIPCGSQLTIARYNPYQFAAIKMKLGSPAFQKSEQALGKFLMSACQAHLRAVPFTYVRVP